MVRRQRQPGPYEGKHFTATRLLNSPQSISRPRVPIMIGGGGERKTLRLVAQYADACNVFGGPERMRHKYAVLREHCERLGRPYEEIERSTLQSVDPERDSAESIVERFGALGAAGAQHMLFSVRGVNDTPPGAARLRGLSAAARRVGWRRTAGR